MKAHEVLTAAAALIREKGWCQHANARDGLGRAVPALDPGGNRRINPEAASFSIYGAIMAAGMKGDRQTQTGLMWDTLVNEARKLRGGTRFARGGQHPVFEFNDHKDQSAESVLLFLTDCAKTLEGVEATSEAPQTPIST